MTHTPAEDTPRAFILKDSRRPLVTQCSLHFVEEQPWILEQLEDPEGTKEGHVRPPDTTAAHAALDQLPQVQAQGRRLELGRHAVLLRRLGQPGL